MRIFLKVGGTIVSALATIVFTTVDIRETVFLFGYSLDWKWFILVAFLFFLGFVIWWIWGLESYKRQIETSKPRLVFKKAGGWQFHTEGKVSYYALQVWFVNNPKLASDTSMAKEVTATLTFYDNDNNKEFEIFGCFTHAEVPDFATIAPVKDLKDKIDVFPPNDIPQKLLIALKWPGDESAYGLSKSNFLATQDLREQAKELKKGTHYVEITLKGVRVDQLPFWFILTNPGREGDLSLTEPIKKPNLHKADSRT